jgi:hypothetical protein
MASLTSNGDDGDPTSSARGPGGDSGASKRRPAWGEEERSGCRHCDATTDDVGDLPATGRRRVWTNAIGMPAGFIPVRGPNDRRAPPRQPFGARHAVPQSKTGGPYRTAFSKFKINLKSAFAWEKYLGN